MLSSKYVSSTRNNGFREGIFFLLLYTHADTSRLGRYILWMLSEPQLYITISYLYTDGNSILTQYLEIIYVVNRQGVPVVCVMMVGLSQRFNIYSANTFDTFIYNIYIKAVCFYFRYCRSLF